MARVYIDPEEWSPQEIVLERDALEAVKTQKNTFVVAGPGAGKTELLAQRACFLLQTNTCRSPKRILAISFKTDATTNLADRVLKRCGEELAERFDSTTFDSFAKGLLDRFRLGLPENHRPSSHYEIDTSRNNEALRKAIAISGKDPDRIAYSPRMNIANSVMNIMLKGSGENDFPPTLTFSLISRLVKHLLTLNPMIVKAITSSYSHIFLDEFQDTTYLQYALVQTCFMDSECILTAVGDHKQRIMIWADALPTAFEEFKSDFGAQELNLLINHRSAPLLIDLQCRTYNALNDEQISIEPDSKWTEDGLAVFHTFKTQSDEAGYIKERIAELLDVGVSPRDICIITKHSVSKYCCELFGELPGTECTFRDENEYQDLLNEDLVKILYSTMICSQEISPEAFTYLNDMEYIVNGVNVENESQARQALANLGILIESVKEILAFACTSDEEAIEGLSVAADAIISHYGEDRLKSTFPQYGGGTYFQKIRGKFINFLHAEYSKYRNWKEALKSFEGEMAIPCMTVHKSKGLEFDTVFFLAIEDGSFFTFDSQRDEDICALFVGISRAERELHLTYSFHRDVFSSRNGGRQSIRRIKEITEALKNSKCLKLDDRIH